MVSAQAGLLLNAENADGQIFADNPVKKSAQSARFASA
jgi:hypothetical protein